MINVSCAIISDNNGKILVTQRSETMKMPLKWEFPGGKIEENETAEECLHREIKEELNIEITVGKTLPIVEYHYMDVSVRLMPFMCRIKVGDVKLTEHVNFVWLEPEKLLTLNWAEADIPILNNLINGN